MPLIFWIQPISLEIKMHSFIIFFLILFMPGKLLAASFDCARAATKIEIFICGDPQLSRADEELAVAYTSALKIASAPGAIKKQQRDWLVDIRNRCNDLACLKEAYSSRIPQLVSVNNVGSSAIRSADDANQQAEQYQTDQGVAHIAQIVADGSGNVMLIWPKRDKANNSKFKLTARRYVADKGWEPELAIYVKKQQVMANAYNDEITAAHLTVGKGWTAPVKGWGPAETTGTYYFDPAIGTDEQGNVMVVWSKLEPYEIADRFVANKAWFNGIDAGRVFVSQGHYLSVRQSIRDVRGNVITVWQSYVNSPDEDPNRPAILFKRYKAGRGWSEPQQIRPDDMQRKNAVTSDIQWSPSPGPNYDYFDEAPRVEFVFDPKIVMDREGNAILMQIEQYGRFDNIWAHRYDAVTGLWGKAQRITNHGSHGVTVTSDIAMNDSGNAVIVWGQGGQIWARQYSAKKSWGKSMLISGKDIGFHPKVAVDGQGNAMVVWQKLSPSTTVDTEATPIYHIYAARFAAGKGWEAPTSIEQGSMSAEFPRITLDTQGNATVVWWRRDNNLYFPVASRFEVDKGWQTPSSAN